MRFVCWILHPLILNIPHTVFYFYHLYPKDLKYVHIFKNGHRHRKEGDFLITYLLFIVVQHRKPWWRSKNKVLIASYIFRYFQKLRPELESEESITTINYHQMWSAGKGRVKYVLILVEADSAMWSAYFTRKILILKPQILD